MNHYRVEIFFCRGKRCIHERNEYVWAKDLRHARNIGWLIILKKYGSKTTGHEPRPVKIK